MNQNKLEESQNLNSEGIEYLESIIDCNNVKIIVLHSITSNYISEIDVAAYIGNIINEQTGFVVFEFDGSMTPDTQVIYHDTSNNKTLVSFKNILNKVQRGIYISFTIRKEENYQPKLKEAVKIIGFMQSNIREGETDMLYERTIEWIKQNITN